MVNIHESCSFCFYSIIKIVLIKKRQVPVQSLTKNERMAIAERESCYCSVEKQQRGIHS